MKRFNLLLPKLSAVLLCCLLSTPLWAQTVTFGIDGNSADPFSGCETYVVTFKVEISNLGGKTVSDVEVVAGNGTTITNSDWLTTNPWTAAISYNWGTYNPSLKVTFSDGSTVTRLLSQQIIVYALPNADFAVTSALKQCFEGNKFSYEDRSTVGKDNAPIKSWDWDFGDGYLGPENEQQNPFHSYGTSGKFDIILTVQDANGCVDREIKKTYIEVYRKIGAKFRVNGPVGCPITDIRFTNLTDIPFSEVKSWIWDWGTGKRYIDSFESSDPDHANNWWTDFLRTYYKDGYSSPKLVVTANDGCKDSFLLVDAIRTVNYKFDITWIPDVPCFTDNSITFNMPERKLATQFLWNFGDPASMQLNVNNTSWRPQHSFVGGPGFYNVSLSILEPPCPVRDTTICFIKLKGPQASINLPAPPFAGNSCKLPVEIPRTEFERIKFDACYRNSSGKTSLEMWDITPTSRLKGRYYVYCNANKSAPLGVNGRWDTAANQQAVNEWDSALGKPNGLGDRNYNFGCGPYYRRDQGRLHPDFKFVRAWLDTLEAPDPGVNGYWVESYTTFTQSNQQIWTWNLPIPVPREIKLIDSLMPVGGGKKVWVDSFVIYPPYVRVHKITLNGTNYVYRPDGPIRGDLKIDEAPYKLKNKVYKPLMAPGTAPDLAPPYNCTDEFRNMHDSDMNKVDCSAPNTVQFVNNSRKYRLFGAKGNEVPPHPNYSWDNFTFALTAGPWAANPDPTQVLPPNLVIDACDRGLEGNPNFPWASDSLQYFWDFGDNSEQCTTYYDGFGNIAYNGPNPTGDPMQCKYSTIVAPQHKYTEDGCWTARLTVYDPVTDCKSEASQPIVMEEPNGGPDDPLGFLYDEKDVNYYNQRVFQQNEDRNQFRRGVQLGVGANPCVGNAVNPYFQRINIQQTLPSCGRETFWMIFNRDDDCQFITCDTLELEVVEEGRGHNEGVYDVAFIPVGGAKFSDTLFGRANINVLGRIGDIRFTQRFDDNGILVKYPRGVKARMIFLDSSALGYDPNQSGDEPIEVYAFVRDSFKINIVERGAGLKEGVHTVYFQEVGKTAGKWPTGKAWVNQFGFVDSVVIDDLGRGYRDTVPHVMTFTDNSVTANARKLPSVRLIKTAKGTESYYQCNWIPEMILQLLGMRWSYGTAGCKTPGIVIKAGDCLDTFFYEGYRYFLDANGDFFLSTDPRTNVIQEQANRTGNDPAARQSIIDDSRKTICIDNGSLPPTKLPYESILSVADYTRNDPMRPGMDPICDARDSITSFKFFITKFASNCGLENSVYKNDSLDPHDGNLSVYKYVDTLYRFADNDGPARGNDSAMIAIRDRVSNQIGDPNLIDLRDTLHVEFRLPGKYVISSSSKADHSGELCFGGNQYETWVGQHQCFRYTDDVVCAEQSITFVDSVFYWHPGGQAFCELIGWWENTTCIDTTKWFYSPKKLRDARTIYKGVPDAYEMRAWDFNAPRFLQKVGGGDSLNTGGQPIRMQDWHRKMDPNDIELFMDEWQSNASGTASNTVQWTYGANGFGVGVYDVTLWARDSMGCWIPYTIQNAVRVVGVEARFGLNTANSDFYNVCIPAGVQLLDSSVVLEDPSLVPGGESITTGLEDSIIAWEWVFGDGRDNSFLQNPLHNYLGLGLFDVKLRVKTFQGCEDEIEIPEYIEVDGIEAKFEVDITEICEGSKVIAHDLSTGLIGDDAQWIWQLGDGSQKNSTGQEYIDLPYKKTGKYKLRLVLSGKVKDRITGVEISCVDSFPNPAQDEEDVFVEITVRQPDSIKLALSDDLICPGEEIRFTVDNDNTQDAYDTLIWKLDGPDDSILVARNEEVKKVYPDPGTYQVVLTGSGEWPICPLTDTAEITVKEVIADVEIDSTVSNFDLGNYSFLNLSTNAVYSQWTINQLPGTNQLLQEVRQNLDPLKYDEFVKGDYRIELIAYDDKPGSEDACSDTDWVEVNVNPIFKIYNVFSPNGDGHNDWFELELEASPEYDLTIYNRWGEVIFKTDQEDAIECYMDEGKGNQICKFWDGTNYRTGAKAPAGTYFYIFNYRFKGDTEMKEPVHGTITLLR